MFVASVNKNHRLLMGETNYHDWKCYNHGHFMLMSDAGYHLQVAESGPTFIYVDGFVHIKGQPDISSTPSGVLKLYEIHGISFTAYLRGEFSVIIWDKTREKMFCTRDHMGTRPLYYFKNKEGLFLSNQLQLLKKHNGPTCTFNEEWMADLLAGTISDKQISPFRDIHRLPPAHVLEVNRENKTVLQKYWELNLENNWEDISEHDAIGHFRTLLNHAVEIRVPANMVVGSELSGGLDSTVVASLADRVCRNTGPEFHAFSHIMEDEDLDNAFPYKDERNLIKELVDYAGISRHHFIRPGEAGILDTLEKSILTQGAPTQQRFYEFSDLLYSRAKENKVKILFSGFGGDEGVSSQGAGYLQELILKNDWSTAWNELQHKHKHVIKVLYKFMMVMAQVRFYNLYQSYSSFFGSEYRRIDSKIAQLPLRRDVMKRFDIHYRAQIKSRFPNDLTMKDRQYKRLMHPHVSQRMEYSAIAAREFGIEYRYPLWDVDLIQFYLQLPSRLKRFNNTGRYIYRKSVEGIIPEIIRWRNDKTGATIPSVFRRLANDADNIEGFLQKCGQKSIGTEFIEMKKMKDWFKRILDRGKNSDNIYQGMFFNYLMLLKYFEWEYEGNI